MSDEQKLAEQLESLIANGTEAEAKQFVIDHFAELPAETQRSLAVGLFADAVEERLTENEEIARIKEKASAAIDAFEEEQA